MTAELHGRDILCFSHDWGSAALSKTHLMRLLSRRNRVLWVNSIGYRRPTASRSDLRRIVAKLGAALQPIREVEPNLFVFNPLALPAYSGGWADLNRHWLRRQVRGAMSRLKFRQPLNFVFNPSAALVAGELGEEKIVYYCVDEYSALAGVNSADILRLEADLMRKAHLVVVSSENLYETKAQFNRNSILVRHGVDFNHFRKALNADTIVPEEIVRLPKPIIGYFGLMSADWVDIGLLQHLAISVPNASLVMLGKIAMDVSPLRRLPNVHFLGPKPYESLPGYCKGFDVGIVPFPINAATLSANPLKLREYLAAGLPVVSTAIPEARAVCQCRIGSDANEFAAQVREALRDPGSRIGRSETMRGEDWRGQLARVENALLSLDRELEEMARMAA